jgi:hypothetical protein
MNIAESEMPAIVAAKTCGCAEHKRKVTYAFQDAYHSLCIDKRDLLSAQLEACERLLRYATDDIDRNAIDKEITELRMTLDLMP